MESMLKEIAEVVARGCELAALVIVAIGALEAVVRAALLAPRMSANALKKQTWIRFAAWILLSLEFALAADIARTAIAPSWDDIGQLAAIAAIRTALNFFLERDLETLARSGETEPGTRPA